MTPEETKRYLEGRLQESGWSAQIGKGSYDKIFRFTEGTEAGANQICYKLLSISSLLPDRQITDDLVEMALDGLTSMDQVLRRSSRLAAQARGAEVVDQESIDQLAATLAAKVTSSDPVPDVAPPLLRRSVPVKGNGKNNLNAQVRPVKRAAAFPPPATSQLRSSKPSAPARANVTQDSFVITQADRLVPRSSAARVVAAATPVTERHRLSSTLTITLGATVFVALTIFSIVYVKPMISQRAAAEAPAEAVAPAIGILPAAPDTSVPAKLFDTPAPRAPAPATAPSTRKETLVSGANAPIPEAVLSKPVAKSVAPAPSGASTTLAHRPVTASPSTSTVTSTAVSKAPSKRSASMAAEKLSSPTTSALKTSAVAPTAPPVAPPLSAVSREDLSELIRRFVDFYEAGDLGQFIGLFAPDARTNDQMSRQGIREDYEKFFNETEARRINLGRLSWDMGENRAQGWGDFNVTVGRKGESETEIYSGSLSFHVQKIDGRLRITRLFHGQHRAGP